MATTYMGLTLPTLGGSSGTWDDLLNALVTLIDAHDHTTGAGKRVPSGGVDFDDDVTITGSWLGVVALGFRQSDSGTISPYSRCLYMGTDNELYWRTAGGVNVKVTNGAALNIALVGGIEGDYSTTTASLYYEDLGKRYKFLQNGPAPDHWASVDAGDVKLYEKASGITNAVTLKSPAALAGAYSLTFPAALPGSTQIVQCSSAGALTFVAAPVVSGVYTGAGFRWTNERRWIVGAPAWVPVGAGAAFDATGREITLSTHTGAQDTPTATADLRCEIGSTITQVVVKARKTSAVGTLTARLVEHDVAGGASSSVASASNSANNPGYINLTMTGLSKLVATAKHYTIQIEGGGTTGDRVISAELNATYAS